jgi:hypothetical protein
MLDGPTPVDSVGQGAAGKKIKLWLNNSNLLKLRTDYNLKLATRFSLVQDCFISYCCCRFLLVPIIILVGLKKTMDGDIVGNRIRRNNRLAKKYLSQAKTI